MSHLQYYAYEGVGVRNQKIHGYNQAVRVGDRIECAGQGRHTNTPHPMSPVSCLPKKTRIIITPQS